MDHYTNFKNGNIEICDKGLSAPRIYSILHLRTADTSSAKQSLRSEFTWPFGEPFRS